MYVPCCRQCHKDNPTKECSTCKTRYCDAKCQLLHWKKHKTICAPTQHERIAKYLKNYDRNDVSGNFLINLGSCNEREVVDCPFPQSRGDWWCESCAVCQLRCCHDGCFGFDFGGMLRNRQVTVYGKRTFVYNRCKTCFYAKRLLCEITYKPQDECRSIYSIRNIYLTMLCAKYCTLRLPLELWHKIWSLCQCSHQKSIL